MRSRRKILALCGGVGGVKLVYGLTQILEPEQLTILVNTGDDFKFFDFKICPDIDTVSYTLAGINNRDKGWGIRNESWNALSFLSRYGAEDWFQLGDKDLAMHIQRTYLLKRGLLLSEVTQLLSNKLGVKYDIVPMSETPVSTILHTNEGELPFQEYFVKLKCKPTINSIEYSGSDEARIPESLQEQIMSNYFTGVVLCPSNPYLSIDPILSIKPIKNYLINRSVPVLAVSPFINNNAVKGPSAKIALELGEMPSNYNITKHYEDILDILIIDKQDYPSDQEIKIKIFSESIIMENDKDKKRLALACLNNLD